MHLVESPNLDSHIRSTDLKQRWVIKKPRDKTKRRYAIRTLLLIYWKFSLSAKFPKGIATHVAGVCIIIRKMHRGLNPEGCKTRFEKSFTNYIPSKACQTEREYKCTKRVSININQSLEHTACWGFIICMFCANAANSSFLSKRCLADPRWSRPPHLGQSAPAWATGRFSPKPRDSPRV